jgi:hypothetical protein
MTRKETENIGGEQKVYINNGITHFRSLEGYFKKSIYDMFKKETFSYCQESDLGHKTYFGKKNSI